MFPTEFRYQSGHSTGAVLRHGRDTRGTELRYIPGESEPQVGECLPLVYRTPFPVSQIIGSVTGYEDTAWAELPGFFYLEGTTLLTMQNLGDAYGMNGLRFECNDLHGFDHWESLYPGNAANPNAISNTSRIPAAQPFEQYINSDRFELSPPFSTGVNPRELYRAAMHGGAYTELSHVTPHSIESIQVPMPWQRTYTGKVNGLPYVGGRLPHHESLMPHGIYITHARVVINGEVAGPLTELGPGTRQKTVRAIGADHTFDVIGEQVCGEGNDSGFRNLMKPNTFELPLFGSLKIQPGDVVGFDMWLRIVRDAWGFQQIGGSPVAWVNGYYRPNWPPDVANVTKHLRWAYEGEASDDITRNDRVSWSEHIKKDRAWWTIGNAAGDYNSDLHTYELDFGDGFETVWTPADDRTFKFEAVGGVSVTNTDCRLYASGNEPYTYELGMDWNGETCCMILFPYGHLRNNLALQFHEITGQPYYIMEVGYYPQESTDADWVAAYQAARPAPATLGFPAGKEGRPGPFTQDGETTFELAYIKFRGRNTVTGGSTYIVETVSQYTTSVGSLSVPLLGPMARVAEVITATRVDQ